MILTRKINAPKPQKSATKVEKHPLAWQRGLGTTSMHGCMGVVSKKKIHAPLVR
jgi:hypothetical protein